LARLIESALGVEHTDAVSVVTDFDRFARRWHALDPKVILGPEDVFSAFRLEVDSALWHSKALE
jgi:hypothetical protein